MRLSSERRLVVARPWIRPAKAIAPRLQLQQCLFRRSAATRLSKVFPTCTPRAARAEAPKQDARSVCHQSLLPTDDRRFPRKISENETRGPEHRTIDSSGTLLPKARIFPSQFQK